MAWLLGWLLMLPAWFAFLEWRPQPGAADAFALLAVMGLVWVADIAAYFSGKAFGRRKLAPSISPGKSWEGVYGGVICVALYVALVDHLGWIDISLPTWALLLLALPLTAVSVMGDLLESWFKRAAGIRTAAACCPVTAACTTVSTVLSPSSPSATRCALWAACNRRKLK